MPLKQLSSAILYGLAVMMGIAAAASALSATFLRFTSVTESTMSWIILFLSFAALFIGGFIAGGKGRQKGMLVGFITGLAYLFIVFLIQFLGFGNGMSMQQLVYHAGFLLTAALGGAAGVNVAVKNS
ncbi:TIGR04086 family membrane protein [Bacillus marinisedimentorum]|uniref:TIGR04086 family membrane protein n=1 Tax=Bacillus marinisedimentorum TaxID=1821260 RepID=UPI0008734B90|nr:TIGR04086 family membrane protein [Bacillus marinisedimentorum]